MPKLPKVSNEFNQHVCKIYENLIDNLLNGVCQVNKSIVGFNVCSFLFLLSHDKPPVLTDIQYSGKWSIDYPDNWAF